MFKTTLDWASDPPPNKFRDPRSAAASPEPRLLFPSPGADSPGGSYTMSPPNSRGSFPRSKRGSVSSTTGTATNGLGVDINIFGLKLAASSISMDRSSIGSDSTRRQSVYEYLDRKRDYRGETSLRQEYVAAVEEMQHKLGCLPIDLLYDRVVDLPLVGAKSVIAIQYARDDTPIAPELMQVGSFRWRHMESVSSSIYTRKEELWSHLTNYYDNVRVSRPSPGLYVGLYYTESTMSGLQILVPKKRRTFVPIVKLREDASLLPEEWDWIQSTASMDSDEFARDCAVSKDDPMHRLKIEFAHSTAKLSKQTQLKWEPSDLYALDTLQVAIHSTTISPPKVPQEIHPFALPPEPPKQGSTTTTTVLQGTVAMDQDPIWKTREMSTSASKTFRVLLFIKPTRHATQPQELFNRQLFEMCPFPVFDALHHSVFNGTTYHELRKSMLQLTNEIVDLEIEMEQETEPGIVQPGDDPRRENKSDGDNNEGEVDSPLIDELGIKEDPLPRMHFQFQRHRHRSSSAGDDISRGIGFRKRSSANSLLEAFERSSPLVSSIMSLSSLLSPNGKENTAIGIAPMEATAVNMERGRSRSSTVEFDLGDRETANTTSRRRGSKASQPDFSRILEKVGDEDAALLDFKEMLQDLDTVPSKAMLPTRPNNSSALSVQSSDSSPSNSSDDWNSHRNDYGQRWRPLQRPLSACSSTKTSGNLSLPPSWPTPRHRRSYSLVQTSDTPLSPGSVSGFSAMGVVRDGNSTRLRTNSHSALTYAHPHPHYPYFHHYQHQQPVYKNRFLTGRTYPHYLAHIQQHQNQHQHHQHQHQHHHQHHNHHEQQHTDQDQDNNDQTCLECCNATDQAPSELIRLERQQQEIQERWRMVSWTRQLNEWDHARTLKDQEELLGFGMDMGLDLSMTLAMSLNLDVAESDPSPSPSPSPSPNPKLQLNGMLSPPQSNSQSSLHSKEA
ncbi:MAG: hypothetical protein J3Q66DRAFT_102134 [Benniella sp.]|nr:MAG: hypothetical protein J3Q66DRAFT_102134 [Benniella sp.]